MFYLINLYLIFIKKKYVKAIKYYCAKDRIPYNLITLSLISRNRKPVKA